MIRPPRCRANRRPIRWTGRRLQPDLILTQDLCRVCAVPSGDVDEALGRLGCRAAVVSLDPHSLDEVMIDIQNVGRAGVDTRSSTACGPGWPPSRRACRCPKTLVFVQALGCG